MAYIDELVSRVDNQALRKDLRAAVKKLRNTRRFGLVYEEHVPEVVALPDLELAVGGLAQNTDGSIWKIDSLNAGGGGRCRLTLGRGPEY